MSGELDRPMYVLAADPGFAMPLAVALRSLSDQCRDPSRFLVCHDGFGAELRERVGRSVAPVHDLEWFPIDAAALDGAKLWNGYTRSTLVRLRLPDQLSDVHRVVYLDADCLVVRDPGELWSASLADEPLAAVRDPAWSWAGAPMFRYPFEALGVDPRQPYFNGGVLVLDLEGWRSERIGDRCLDLIREHHFVDADQGALNAVLGHRFTPLAPSWNVQSAHFDEHRSFAPVFETPARIREALEEPAILHFNRGTFGRPWLPYCWHPFAEQWYAVAESAGWSTSSIPRRRTLGVKIRTRLASIRRVALHGG